MSSDTDSLGSELLDYCTKFYIPREHVLEILYDQKVLPMIRGKGMEFNAYYAIKHALPQREWIVEKLNLSAQPGTLDKDIQITHRRTDVRMTVESKSAVRGSFRLGNARTKIRYEPYFRVKCHRSRSNIKLADTTNDRYSVEAFDIVITNPLNSLYMGNTIGEDLELVALDQRDALYQYYEVTDGEELQNAASRDWRFAVTSEIAEDGFVPRTPCVKLRDDPRWRPLDELAPKLLEIVHLKR